MRLKHYARTHPRIYKYLQLTYKEQNEIRAVLMNARPGKVPSSQPGPITSQFGGGEPTYFDGLNPEQREAIETIDGPLLVLAGAGTGKTRVLTTRIAHILATRRARGFEILSVTFTNKAAREMKERIARFVGGSVEGMPWLGTFHSIGAKIIRRHAELIGLKSDFTILDTDDQIRLLKQLLKAENIDEKALARQTTCAHDRRVEKQSFATQAIRYVRQWPICGWQGS